MIKLSYDSKGCLEMHKVIDKDKHVPLKCNVLVPKIKSDLILSFDEWYNKYESFLRDYVDELWISLCHTGLIIDYMGYRNQMYRTIYNKSISKHKKFTFLDT